MLTYIKLKFGGYIPYHRSLRGTYMLFISYWEVYIDSKLLLNDLENAIFQKYRHFGKIVIIPA